MSDGYLVDTKTLMYGHDQVYGGVRVVKSFYSGQKDDEGGAGNGCGP